MRQALVCGAGGFIGSHLVSRLKREGFWVRGVDRKRPAFAPTDADDFLIGDLGRAPVACHAVDRPFDHVYQLAAEMGGAGYVFSGDNDAAIMHGSAAINLHVVEACRRAGVGRVFFASSACIYPTRSQLTPDRPDCSEAAAYPADPDSEYGWEKLFSERLYAAYQRNHGLAVRIARLHNVFGPRGTWRGGREKAPAALCRKIAQARDGAAIEIWGDGQQTRSFLYIDECIEGVRRIMDSDLRVPVNLGSEELIRIDDLARLIARIAGKTVSLRHVAGPLGVRGRRSDNRLIARELGWAPSTPLRAGLAPTYAWIELQVAMSVRQRLTMPTRRSDTTRAREAALRRV